MDYEDISFWQDPMDEHHTRGLYLCDGRYLVADSIITLDAGPETMLFKANKNGHISRWDDLYSERHLCSTPAEFGKFMQHAVKHMRMS